MNVNLDQSEVYFGGFREEVEEVILQEFGLRKGTFPCRCLGVPLSTSRLTYCQCRRLDQRITEKVHNWASKKLFLMPGGLNL